MKNRQSASGCSFCGKQEGPQRRLIAGPGVYICNECVALCNEILSEPPAEASVCNTARTSGPGKEPWWKRFLTIARHELSLAKY